MKRRLFTFDVKLRVKVPVMEGDEPAKDDEGKIKTQEVDRFLSTEGDWTDDAGKAARFEFYATPSRFERQEIQRRCAEWAGGEERWAELQGTVQVLQGKARKELIDDLWPGGKPEVETPADAVAQAAELEEAWKVSEGMFKTAFAQANTRLVELEFMGQWNVTAKHVPAGWEDLSALELDDTTFMYLWEAFESARTKAVEGNG